MPGETIGTAYVRILADGDGLDRSVEREFKKTEPAIHKAGKSGAKEYHDGFDEESDHRSKETLKRLSESITIGEKDFKRIGEDLGSDLWRGIESDLEKRTKSHSIARLITAQLQNDFRKLDGDFGKLGEHIEKNFTHLVADAGRELDRLGHDAETATTHLGRMGRSVDQTGDFFAKAFGKGARNNFFNLTGTIVGGITKAVGLVPKAIDGFGKLGETFFKIGTGGQEAADGALKAGEGASKAGASFGELAASGVASGIALAAVVAAVSIAVSVLSLLAGVVVALAASISFALIGALGALLGLLLPVGAAVTVLGLAFLGLGKKGSEARDQLAGFLEPITTQFKALASVTRQHLFANLVTDGKTFGKGLGNLRPLILSTADALSHMFSEVAKASASPAFAKYIQTISDFTKTALPQLGAAVGHTFEGIGGIFTALIPLTQRFLDSMTRGSESFSKFANGADGQNKLTNFFKRAGDSAADLGHLLVDTTKLLGQLFSAGKGTGDNIIEQLDGQVRHFTEYLKKNPKAVAGYFKDVQHFADELGHLSGAVIKLFDALDSPQGRKAATDIFGIITDIIKGTVALTPAFESVGGAIRNFVGVISDGFGIIADSLGYLLDGVAKIGGVFNKLIPGSHDFGKAARDAASDMHGLADTLHNFANEPGINVKVKALEAKKAQVAIDNMVKTYEDAFGLPPGKLKVDASDVSVAAKTLKTLVDSYTILKDKFDKPLKPKTIPDSLKNLTAEQLKLINNQRIMAGLAPYVAKAHPAQLKDVTKEQLKLINQQREAAGLKPINLKATHDPIDKSKAAILKLVNQQRVAAGLKPITIKALYPTIRPATSAINSFVIAANKLHNKSVTITTNKVTKISTIRGDKTGTTAATGGIMDEMGNVSKRFAIGGIASSQFNLRGNTAAEAGREAIVPLDRPLDQVDPSVRYLAAIAQGLNPGGGSTTVNNNLTVITPTKDPRAVAIEAVNELAAQGGY